MLDNPGRLGTQWWRQRRLFRCGTEGWWGRGYYATTLLLHLFCCETGEQLPGRLPQALLSTEAQLSHTEVGQK